MAKRPHRVNINEPGHAHELTFSCYRRFPFLRAEQTCQWLADEIDKARSELNFSVWAYVLMPDHAHVLLFPREKIYDIADIRKAIKAPVAVRAIADMEENSPEWLPKITRKRGKKTERVFWQSGGGYDRNVENGRTLGSMIDYIHANPVRRGLVERGVDWKWSSAAWFELGESIPLAVDPIPPDWLEAF